MKKKDQVSSFIAEELLYDFLNGDLDATRSQAVEEVLKSNPPLKAKFENLKKMKLQLKDLSDFAVPKDWVENLSLPDPSLAQQLVSLEKKVAPRFWRAFPYAMVGLTVVVGLIVAQPWKALNLREVEVAHISLVDDPYLKDQVPEIEEGPATPVDVKEVKETKIAGSDTKPEQPQVLKTEQPTSTSPVKTSGLLYRSSIVVSNLQVSTAQTIEKIAELGGRKAGQVELGWERDENERYFHFSLPESNREALVKFLSGFGPVRISSQEHPLVMPKGKIRIILIVKQKSSPQEPSAGGEVGTEEEMDQSAGEDEEAQ